MPALDNDQHELFCNEYMRDLNATQAYIRAGYSENGAGQSANKLLKNTDVRARVDELMSARVERAQLSSDWVLIRLQQISDRSMQVEEVQKFDPDTKQMVGTGEYVFDSTGANRATELIGKHFNMFINKVEVTDTTAPNLDKLSIEDKLAYLELQKKLRG